MNLPARQIAAAAGAQGDQIEKLAQQLVLEKTIRAERAEQILKEWRKKADD
jgi:hydroxymethylglutaryl-CoA reductase